jgi:hypothetical protein
MLSFHLYKGFNKKGQDPHLQSIIIGCPAAEQLLSQGLCDVKGISILY